MKQLMMDTIYFYSFQFLVVLLCLKKDCSFILSTLDETYRLFDLEKHGWSDNYTA